MSRISEAKYIDNIEYMQKFPDNFFDLANVDIEYGIGASKPSVKPNNPTQKNGDKLRVKKPNYIPKEWDNKQSGKEYFDELFRVSKDQIIFGANYYGIKGGCLVWDKLNGSNDQMDCEVAYCSFNSRCDLVYYMWSGMFQGVYCGKDVRKALVQQGNKLLNEKRIHPTQKPIMLYDWIYKEYLPKGGKVLDTHLGSGSNRIAADRAGNIDFYSCENDLDHFNDQEKRWKQYKAQLVLKF